MLLFQDQIIKYLEEEGFKKGRSKVVLPQKVGEELPSIVISISLVLIF